MQRTSLTLKPPPRRHRRELLLLRSRSRWREIRRLLPFSRHKKPPKPPLMPRNKSSLPQLRALPLPKKSK